MLFATLRIIKFAWQDFFRNFWLSFVTLTILVLALFSINALIILNLVANSAVGSIEDKIDINVYFKAEIPEDQVKNIQNYLQSLAQVKEVQYISKEQAIANFKETHKDNPKILKSLEEIDDNPLGASLLVKAKTTYDYPFILNNLEEPQYDNLIESKDFDDHKKVIDRITGITQKVTTGVIVIAFVFTLVSILIIFNAIRIALYTHRDEIIAMKLMGATNWFIRSPFLLQGIIFAVLAICLTIIIIYPLLGFIQPYIGLLLDNNFNLIDYFNHGFVMIFGLELLGAIAINLISSYWAVNKYLNV